jgi:hypothetical protein
VDTEIDLDDHLLTWILHSLDRVETTPGPRVLRSIITSLETLLRDDDEPQVGRYGEQELSGFVTKFKSLLHDYVSTNQEDVYTISSYRSITICII